MLLLRVLRVMLVLLVLPLLAGHVSLLPPFHGVVIFLLTFMGGMVVACHRHRRRRRHSHPHPLF